jgi:hypothetical protein
LRAGFPHSDIHGSKLACQLPVAYRRLQRPSSPVVAKASTTCTCSLDPITLNTLNEVCRKSGYRSAWYCKTRNAIITQTNLVLRRPDSLHFFRIVKEQPKTKPTAQRFTLGARFCAIHTRAGTGGANRDRTGDLLLAKQALSQLSYGPA